MAPLRLELSKLLAASRGAHGCAASRKCSVFESATERDIRKLTITLTPTHTNHAASATAPASPPPTHLRARRMK